MADDKVLYPETIEDNPLPNEATGGNYKTSQSTRGGSYSAQKTKDQSLPTRRIAVELLSSALNTRTKRILGEFEFTPSGAIQVGKYVSGVSGDLRISPNGIAARDESGVYTFAIDAQTGSAVFKGTVQAGTLIGGEVIVGNNTWVIDGDPDKPRIILYNNNIPEILIGDAE